uniref:Uncharacterized protein n=1 Tax=Branchiostoma floridae TaxID=7739 RepID=C3ZZ80_BRAFL|eukprot:XP_002586129.1 hypothetical protein BRAFLDRAFT_131241 [Branchiostoma floridae]
MTSVLRVCCLSQTASVHLFQATDHFARPNWHSALPRMGARIDGITWIGFSNRILVFTSRVDLALQGGSFAMASPDAEPDSSAPSTPPPGSLMDFSYYPSLYPINLPVVPPAAASIFPPSSSPPSTVSSPSYSSDPSPATPTPSRDSTASPTASASSSPPSSPDFHTYSDLFSPESPTPSPPPPIPSHPIHFVNLSNASPAFRIHFFPPPGVASDQDPIQHEYTHTMHFLDDTLLYYSIVPASPDSDASLNDDFSLGRTGFRRQHPPSNLPRPS